MSSMRVNRDALVNLENISADFQNIPQKRGLIQAQCTVIVQPQEPWLDFISTIDILCGIIDTNDQLQMDILDANGKKVRDLLSH